MHAYRIPNHSHNPSLQYIGKSIQRRIAAWGSASPDQGDQAVCPARHARKRPLQAHEQALLREQIPGQLLAADTSPLLTQQQLLQWDVVPLLLFAFLVLDPLTLEVMEGLAGVERQARLAQQVGQLRLLRLRSSMFARGSNPITVGRRQPTGGTRRERPLTSRKTLASCDPGPMNLRITPLDPFTSMLPPLLVSMFLISITCRKYGRRDLWGTVQGKQQDGWNPIQLSVRASMDGPRWARVAPRGGHDAIHTPRVD